MKTFAWRALTFAILLVGTAPLASANLINNCDFQTGDFTGWTTTLAASGSNLSVASVPAPHDTLGVRFGATGDDAGFDSISQTFATTPGALYDLSFFYQVGNTASLANNHFIALFNGVNISITSTPIRASVPSHSPT
jgi:hypothetical protein